MAKPTIQPASMQALKDELNIAVAAGELSRPLADEVLRDTENAVRMGRQMDRIFDQLFGPAK